MVRDGKQSKSTSRHIKTRGDEKLTSYQCSNCLATTHEENPENMECPNCGADALEPEEVIDGSHEKDSLQVT